MRYLIALIMVGASAPSFALTMGLHIGSWHSNSIYNNINPGIYISKNNYVIGTYHNSIKRQSFYAGYNFQYKNVGITTGLITGYREKVLPFIFPSVKYKNIRLLYIPKINKNLDSHVIHLMIEKEF